MNNLEKWLISIEPEKVIEEIQKRELARSVRRRNTAKTRR